MTNVSDSVKKEYLEAHPEYSDIIKSPFIFFDEMKDMMGNHYATGDSAFPPPGKKQPVLKQISFDVSNTPVRGLIQSSQSTPCRDANGAPNLDLDFWIDSLTSISPDATPIKGTVSTPETPSDDTKKRKRENTGSRMIAALMDGKTEQADRFERLMEASSAKDKYSR